ncbi:MAG: signal peptidase I [Patescibacteria group bacterium]
MNTPITFGNMGEVAPLHRGWVVGRFIEMENPLHSTDVEIKYHVAKKGEHNEVVASSKAQSLTILIRGEFKISFPEQSKEFILKKEGDFIFWNPGIGHDWEVREDSLLITVRWPSL